MTLLVSRTGIIIILAVVLALQWALATLALYLLLKDKGITKNILGWNIFIMFGIIVGPISYLIIRKKNS